MVRKTMKMFVAVLIAAFALSSMAEAATPKKTRHRTKHSSRVSSGAVATTGKTPAAKRKAAPKTGTHAKSSATAQPLPKPPAKRRPTTKPHRGGAGPRGLAVDFPRIRIDHRRSKSEAYDNLPAVVRSR